MGNRNKAKVKVVSKTLALQSYQKLSNNYLLLDSAIFVYIFYLKKRFSNFGRPAKRQGLLFNKKIILIKSWEEVSLILKIQNLKLNTYAKKRFLYFWFSIKLCLTSCFKKLRFHITLLVKRNLNQKIVNNWIYSQAR